MNDIKMSSNWGWSSEF